MFLWLTFTVCPPGKACRRHCEDAKKVVKCRKHGETLLECVFIRIFTREEMRIVRQCKVRNHSPKMFLERMAANAVVQLAGDACFTWIVGRIGSGIGSGREFCAIDAVPRRRERSFGIL